MSASYVSPSSQSPPEIVELQSALMKGKAGFIPRTRRLRDMEQVLTFRTKLSFRFGGLITLFTTLISYQTFVSFWWAHHAVSLLLIPLFHC